MKKEIIMEYNFPTQIMIKITIIIKIRKDRIMDKITANINIKTMLFQSIHLIMM